MSPAANGKATPDTLPANFDFSTADQQADAPDTLPRDFDFSQGQQDTTGQEAQTAQPTQATPGSLGDFLNSATQFGKVAGPAIGRAVAAIPQAAQDYYQLAGEHLKKGEYLQAAGTIMSALGGAPSEGRDPLIKMISGLVDAHREQTKAQPTPAKQEPTPKAAAPRAQLREAPPDIDSAIQQAAEKYELDPKLIQAVVQSESNFNPEAKGSSGEIGLMQLMPETRATLGMSDEDARDVEKNIDAGARWLKAKIDAHGGDIEHGLTAYNGSGAKAREYARNVMALYGQASGE